VSGRILNVHMQYNVSLQVCTLSTVQENISLIRNYKIRYRDHNNPTPHPETADSSSQSHKMHFYDTL
jgi:hypothetical protein